MQRTVPRVAEAGARHIPASATVHHRFRQAVGCGAGHSSSDTPSETPVIQILRHCTANISGRTQRGKLSDVYVALCTLQRPPFLHRPTCPAPPNGPPRGTEREMSGGRAVSVPHSPAPLTGPAANSLAEARATKRPDLSLSERYSSVVQKSHPSHQVSRKKATKIGCL